MDQTARRALWFHSDQSGEPAPSAPEASRPSVFVWIAAAAGLAGVAFEVWRWTWHRAQLDFAVYLLGAHHLTDSQLYHVGLSYPPHLPFTYPPFAALLFWPLSLGPAPAAALVWATVNIAALWIILYVSLRAVAPSWSSAVARAAATLLLAPAIVLEPVSLTFSYGQINLVLAALVLVDLTGASGVGRRTLPRGVLVGLSAAVKLVPLIFIPYLVLTRQRRAAAVATVTFLGASLLAAAFDPASSWSYWTKYAVDAQRVGNVDYISNQSLRGAAARLTHHLLSAGVATLAEVLVLVAGLALAAWAAKVSSPFLGVLLCAATGLLASPITWAHHMVWIAPVLLWLWWAPDRPRGGRPWAVAAGALFWWAPIWSVPDNPPEVLREHGWQLLRGNSFFVATAVFVASAAIMLARRQRRTRRGVTIVPVEGTLRASGPR